MLVSKGHAATRAILIWVTYAVIRVMVRPGSQLLPRATSGFMVLLQLGPEMMMFMA